MIGTLDRGLSCGVKREADEHQSDHAGQWRFGVRLRRHASTEGLAPGKERNAGQPTARLLDRAAIAEHVGRVGTYALHAISLTQPPPTGRVAAVKIGAEVPYLMVEARLKADPFDAGIPKEGVIVYLVQTPDPLGHRVDHLRPLVLKTPAALAVGQACVSE